MTLGSTVIGETTVALTTNNGVMNLDDDVTSQGGTLLITGAVTNNIFGIKIPI